MGADLVSEVGVHTTFRRRSDRYRLLEVTLATEITVNATTYFRVLVIYDSPLGNPRDLCRKPLDMVLLPL